MTADPQAARRPRLLLVEDYPLGRNVGARVLSQAFRVTLASSGEEALERTQSATFEVILADFRMPVMTGIELLEHLRLLEPRMRRVLMSCAPVPGLVGFCATGLVQGFLGKPFDLRTACTVLHPEALSLTR
jgi:CheY-like chemotaxis protein